MLNNILSNISYIKHANKILIDGLLCKSLSLTTLKMFSKVNVLLEYFDFL